MQRRWIERTAALMAVSVTAGCGLVGSPDAPKAQSGRISLGHETLHTQSYKCTQEQWTMDIDAKSGDTIARAKLDIGGEKPVAETVNIEHFKGLNAIASEGFGSSEVATKGSITYTITGTAVVTDMAHPSEPSNQPFEIEVSC